MRGYMLRVKASEEDASEIKARAKAAGETMSGYIRRLAARRAVGTCEAQTTDDDAEAIRQGGRLLKGVLEGREKADALKKVEDMMEALCRGHQAG